MTAFLHINDNNLLIQQGQTFTRSQGYAWLKEGNVYFDLQAQNNAVANCRIEPQQISTRYWQQCEQTSIAANDSGMRHAADLVWRHLTELKKAVDLDDVVLVVPSHYQTANLQLLLGIAKSCGLSVSGLLNKAVLALHQRISADENYLHVDVQLHQTVCSEVIANRGKAQLGKIEILHEVGLHAMQDSLLKAIQKRFILNDRFDPLHYAETEQQLFDQLPQLARTLANEGKANVAIGYQGRQHGTSIDQKQWDSAIEHFAKQLFSVEVESKIDHRFYDFNGFQAVTFADKDRSALSQTPLLTEELLHAVQADERGNLVYCTELLTNKFAQESTSAVPQKGTSAHQEKFRSTSNSGQLMNYSDNQVTHLMQAGVAVPLAQAQIDTHDGQLGISVGHESNLESLLAAQKIFIMGDMQSRTLQVNDRIGSNLADGVISAIQVVQGDCTGKT